MTWVEDLLNTYGKLKLAQDAKDLEDNQHVLAADRAAVAAQHRRTFGEAYQAPEGEGMIHIGDQHQHMHAPAKKPGLGLLGKAAVAFAFGGPIGLGLMAAPLVGQAIQNWMRPQPAVPAPVEPGPDRDSISGIELLDPRFPE